MKVTRRRFLIGSAAVAAVATAGNSLAIASGNPPKATGNPLLIPKVIPGGHLGIRNSTAQIFPGEKTNVFSIGGVYPAPTIRLRKGDTFYAHIVNEFPLSDLVLHWHGLHVPPQYDGHPKDALKPNGSIAIEFPVINRAGTYFWHSHTDMNTATQVYFGLAGMLIIDDDEDSALPLPKDDFDVPLMISDKRFDSNNQLVYSLTNNDKHSGWLGDKILVNGTPDPYLEVAPTLYRFRVLNASNARGYFLALSDDSEFTVIAGDGGLLEAPVKTKTCFLTPSERVDILIDFSKMTAGSSVTLKSLFFPVDETPPPSPIPANGAVLDIIRFDITGTGNSEASIPTTLSTIEKYKESDAKRSKQFSFEMFGLDHQINGQSFEMHRIDYTIPKGELEIWEFTNTTPHIHPVHVHGTQFQVLERGGQPPKNPNDLGWKDTVSLNGVGDSVRVLVKFDTYEGNYLIHCHNLEHEDSGMMSNFIVAGDGAVSEILDDRELSVYPNPAKDHTIVMVEKSDAEIMISDLNGKTIIRQAVTQGVSSVRLDVSELASGTYRVGVGGRSALLTIIK